MRRVGERLVPGIFPLHHKILNFFGGRYHNSFKKIEQDWLMSRSEYILDYNFTSEVSDLGDAMDQLQSGVGLDMNDKLYRKLHKQ